MPDRPFNVEVLYHNLEEVLGMNVVYVERDATPFSGQDKCEFIAREIADRTGQFVGAGVTSDSFRIISVICKTPQFEGAGSAKFERYSLNEAKGDTFGKPVPDSITALAIFDTAGTPQGAVTGGLRISLHGEDSINCNSWADDNDRTNLETFLDVLFPRQITGTFGPFDHVVESNMQGSPTRYIDVVDIRVNAILGSDRQRIPNRPQKRGRANGDPQPDPESAKAKRLPRQNKAVMPDATARELHHSQQYGSGESTDAGSTAIADQTADQAQAGDKADSDASNTSGDE